METKDVEDPQLECRCSRIRTWFLISLVLALMFIYYANLAEVSEIWATTIQMIYNTTGKHLATNATIKDSDNMPFTINNISGNKETAPTTAWPTKQPCVPEIPYHVAYPCNYNYTVNEAEKCRTDNPFLVLMVPVAPYNKEARDAVRSTWGSEKIVMGKVVRLFFMLGQPGSEGLEEQQRKVMQESEEHHDIVQSTFLDSYNNLTIKTMVIMEWLAAYCQNASYGMKIDVDMFLNLDLLVSTLLHAPTDNYMAGLVARGAVVLRDPNSKWFLPKDVFPEDFYPRYALGLGYVFSLDIPNKLIKAARHVPAVYIEDVYLGLCMRYLRIALNENSVNLFHVFPVPYNRCQFSRLIATTTTSLQQQVDSWKDLKRPGPVC